MFTSQRYDLESKEAEKSCECPFFDEDASSFADPSSLKLRRTGATEDRAKGGQLFFIKIGRGNLEARTDKTGFPLSRE